jgi:hypothetical protein
LDLVDKKCENLVEALMNNTISGAVDSLSWPNNILPSSSPAFPSTYNQSDTYRIEDQEIYDNSKGDIA